MAAVIGSSDTVNLVAKDESPQSAPDESGDFDDLSLELDDDIEVDVKSMLSDDAEVDSWVERASRKPSSTLSALSAYQRAAEYHGSMSPEDQLLAAAEYQQALKIKAALESGAYSGGELRKAQRTVRGMDLLMEKLTSSCWRLAWLIVRENAEGRFGREKASEMLPDLMSEANLALVEAVKQFDPTKTPTFATYAARNVRNHVRMVISNDGYIHLAPSWSRIKRVASARVPELTAELGRTPSREEIQADLLETCLNWAERKLTDEQRKLGPSERHDLKMAKLRKQGMLRAIREIDEVMAATQSVASLDQPVGEVGGATLGDLLPGQSSPGLFDDVELSELRGTIGVALASLTDRERDIIMLRFGFVDNENWTYAKIAERYDVTPERIRQIERAVLGKLSSPHGQYSALASFLPSQTEDPEPESRWRSKR